MKKYLQIAISVMSIRYTLIHSQKLKILCAAGPFDKSSINTKYGMPTLKSNNPERVSFPVTIIRNILSVIIIPVNVQRHRLVNFFENLKLFIGK